MFTIHRVGVDVGNVAAIITGHTVYFLNTLIGGDSLQYIPKYNCPTVERWTPGVQRESYTLIFQILKACQLLSANSPGHRIGGNCGEVVAAMAFCTVNPNGSLVGAKVVSWGIKEGTHESVWDPCD